VSSHRLTYFTTRLFYLLLSQLRNFKYERLQVIHVTIVLVCGSQSRRDADARDASYNRVDSLQFSSVQFSIRAVNEPLGYFYLMTFFVDTGTCRVTIGQWVAMSELIPGTVSLNDFESTCSRSAPIKTQ